MERTVARSILAILAAVSLVLIAWDVAEAAVGHRFSVALPFPVFVAVGLAVIALAWSLLMREYPLRHLHLRHASHA